MVDKVVALALEFLLSNISDPEVEAMVAVNLGLAENEEDYEGEKYDKIVFLIKNAQRTLLKKEQA